MTREENILTLNEHLEHWKRLLSEKICDQDEGEKIIDALQNAIKALEQEPCGYAVSRRDVEDAIAEAIVNGESLGYGVAYDILSDLPPVTPQQKMGRWSHDGSHWENRFICSECRYKLFDEQTNYCPNCGSKMQEVEG